MRLTVIAIGMVLVAAIGCRRSEQPVASDELQSDSAIESQSLQEPTLKIKAMVTDFSPGASWSHDEDGSFEVTDAITLTITHPKFLAGKELTVHYNQPTLPDDSPLRKLETICMFTIDNEFVTPPEKGTHYMIYGGALENLTFLDRDNP